MRRRRSQSNPSNRRTLGATYSRCDVHLLNRSRPVSAERSPYDVEIDENANVASSSSSISSLTSFALRLPGSHAMGHSENVEHSLDASLPQHVGKALPCFGRGKMSRSISSTSGSRGSTFPKLGHILSSSSRSASCPDFHRRNPQSNVDCFSSAGIDASDHDKQWAQVISEKYANCGTLTSALQANGWTVTDERDPAGGPSLKWASVADIHKGEFDFGTKLSLPPRSICKTACLVNHFCKERCKAVGNKRLLLRHLREVHDRRALSRWVPRSYDLTNIRDRELFIEDFAETAAEALLSRVAKGDISVSKETLDLALAVLDRSRLSHAAKSRSRMDIRLAAEDLTRQLARESCADAVATGAEICSQASTVIQQRLQDSTRQLQTSAFHNLWFIKKVDVDCGEGIAVDWRLPELLRVAESFSWSAVAQKYVERPLAPEGRKMDLRIWMLILSWVPMQALLWGEPYARLASKPFNFKSSEIKDPLVHLTNRCQQQKGEQSTVEESEGVASESDTHCWTMPRLVKWLRGSGGFKANVWEAHVWPRLVVLARRVLRAFEVIPGSRPSRGVRSFELVGLDVLLDEALEPWFLEANCSPDLCHDADPVLHESVCRCLKGALALVKRARDEEHSSWLPPAAEVDAASGGLSLPGADGWMLIRNQS